MSKGDQEKANLFTAWLDDHLDGNVVPLFSSLSPSYELTEMAGAFFNRPEEASLYLYILLVKRSDEVVPVYIGKATSPRKRWLNGHLPRLRRERSAIKPTSYSKWIKSLENAGEVFLFCIHESAIKYPPIPGFPKTVGSIEYQLVSLAQDAFPGLLLNSEGVGR